MKEVTFQKKNGDIIKRYMYYSSLPYRVGYINCYGWTVIDIKKCYNGKYYSLDIYDKMLRKRDIKDAMIRELKNKINKGFNELSRLFILLIFIKFINTIINI